MRVAALYSICEYEYIYIYIYIYFFVYIYIYIYIYALTKPIKESCYFIFKASLKLKYLNCVILNLVDFSLSLHPFDEVEINLI